LLCFSIRGRSVTAASVAISISILLEAIFFFFFFLIFFFWVGESAVGDD
jgi:hypothetical protein